MCRVTKAFSTTNVITSVSGVAVCPRNVQSLGAVKPLTGSVVSAVTSLEEGPGVNSSPVALCLHGFSALVQRQLR